MECAYLGRLYVDLQLSSYFYADNFDMLFNAALDYHLVLQSVSRALRGQCSVRAFNTSPLAAQAAKVAMSHLDPGSQMPYEKLQANLSVVKNR